MKRASVAVAVLMAAMAAQAAEPAEQAGSETPAQESLTRDWLELQRSGTAASEQPQPLSGAAMDKVHERYVKSFGHPQPEHFKYDEPISK